MKILCVLNLDDQMDVAFILEHLHIYKIGENMQVRIGIFQFGIHIPLLEVVEFIDRIMKVDHVYL